MKPSLLLGIVLACAMTQARPLAAEPVPEYSMKAAYLYNFALFTEWPALPSDQLHLCILGKAPFGTALDSIDGKSVNGRRLTVRRIAGISTARSCQMLFLGEMEGDSIHRLLLDIADEPVLTVTDSEDYMQADVMIKMSLEDRRLAFEINTEAARRARLSFSSKLLHLAKTVYRAQP